MQDEITASVSAAILPTMERSERERAARKPPGSLDAWECYQRGLWHFSKIDARENAEAVKFFERATELDRGFAAAYAALADTILVMANLFRPWSERQTLVPRAIEHARRAVALDPSGAPGHSSLARALVYAGRHEEALPEAELAVNLDPNSALAHANLGFTRAFGGRPREAIESLELAMRLSPFDPFMPRLLHWLGRAYYLIGDYAAAVTTARRVCQSYPDFQGAYRTLIAALGQTGQTEDARRLMADAVERFGEGFFRSMNFTETRWELRTEDNERMLEGYRMAGVVD